MNIKASTENVNGNQKVPQQKFEAYEDFWCYNIPHFDSLYSQ